MSIANRLKKNFKHKNKWAKRENIDAYRLYDRDIPDYPYIVDIYQDHVIIYLRLKEIDLDPKKEAHIDELFAGLEEIGFSADKHIVKSRKVQSSKDQYTKEASLKLTKKVQEREMLFKVNLTDYLDTGLFLDHRPLRKTLSSLELKGQTALNLFSYTCSLSVALAYAGATVTSVDMSKTYLSWGEENFAINDQKIYEHHFVAADCMSYVKENEQLFDIIIVDPPSFSNSKKMTGSFDIQRDHDYLLRKCYEFLRPGGKLYFSNNLRSFKLETNLPFKDITSSSIPVDFKDTKIHHLFYLEKEL
jgi:23S rRNA (cytosine1962-C5)-methyltransferase/23S rRNA (guanine2445-N2)-methyltransferase / 23S rRNA (guanine2069-N7)-methyltransferase